MKKTIMMDVGRPITNGQVDRHPNPFGKEKDGISKAQAGRAPLAKDGIQDQGGAAKLEERVV